MPPLRFPLKKLFELQLFLICYSMRWHLIGFMSVVKVMGVVYQHECGLDDFFIAEKFILVYRIASTG
jgi:hypothetical protein